MITPRNYRTDYDPHTDWGCDIPSPSDLAGDNPGDGPGLDPGERADLVTQLAQLQAHVNGRRSA